MIQALVNFRDSVGEHPKLFLRINVCQEALSGILNPQKNRTSRVSKSPLHHQDNHAGNTAIEEVIYVVKAWASRETFFQGDKVGEPITSLETQLRIKLMMHTVVNLADDKEGS